MSKAYRRSLCWIRRDLRLHDHAALAAATAESDEVAVVFVFDTCILRELQDKDDRRLTFIHKSLEEIDRGLAKVNSALFVAHGDPVTEIPSLAERLGVEAVFTARDYEPYAVKRDAQVAEKLGESNLDFRTVKDSVIMEPDEVQTKSGTPFRVYSPYARAWRERFQEHRDAANHALAHYRFVQSKEHPLDSFSLQKLGFQETELWLEPGEKAAKKRLEHFEDRLADYKDQRNFPAKDATSGLSVHLRFGTVSVRECVRRALKAGALGNGWLGELIWRDFFQHVLHHFPHVVDHPFQEKYRHVHYPGTDEMFLKWCEGQTGYPIVDAAMRHFNETGWMHNRLRMVVASFLTKDLLVDYRKGEAYFARYLLDFDLASNNGNWQWAASTGCDAQPYFRIFNPITQSQKFDPEGTFIRAHLPVLAGLDGYAIHFPAGASEMELIAANVELGKTYPRPLVDHAEQREQAIALLARADG